MKPMFLMMMAVMIGGCGALSGCERSAQPAKQTPIEQAALAGKTPDLVGPSLTGPTRHILALGDSLFAGYGLRIEQSYPARLEASFQKLGINARISNAGVSGDTTADGLARLAFTLSAQQQKPDLVLICLGGNDMLRGLPPRETRDNLSAILAELKRRKIPVVLMGMLAAPNLGKEYAAEFNAIYPDLAKRNGAGLVPFFLQSVIDRDDLRQADHIHPTSAGIEKMVAATMGKVGAELPPR